MASLLGSYFLGVGIEWGLSQKPPMSIFLNCSFKVIDATDEVASLLFTVTGSTDNRLPYDFW